MAVLGGMEEQGTQKTVGRRGVIAGAAALAAALIAKQTADPVGAANGGPVLIGNANTGSATTELDVTPAVAGGFRVVNPSGTAVPDTTQDALQVTTERSAAAMPLPNTDWTMSTSQLDLLPQSQSQRRRTTPRTQYNRRPRGGKSHQARA